MVQGRKDGLHKRSRTFRGETLGQRLRRLRHDKGLSQRDLADACERVTYAYVSRIEHDHRRPTTRAIREMAAVLGVTPNYLEFGTEVDPELAKARREIASLERKLTASETENIKLREAVVDKIMSG